MLVSWGKVHLAEKWLVMVAVTLGMFMSLMDNTIVNVAISTLQTTFKADLQSVQWVVTIYMLTQAAVIPTAPYLMARFGGRRAYVGTLIAFLGGSVLCGFAWDLPSLIFFRLVQGIGGGILLPLVTTLLYQAFGPEERASAVSAMGIPMMIAPAFGPVLGGYLVFNFGWQWAFFINIPVGIVSVVLSLKVLRDQPAEKRPHFDFAGFLTAAGASVTILYSISELTSGNSNPIVNTLFLGCGILLAFSFVVIELVTVHRGKEPLLDLRCFRDRIFAFSNLTNVFVAFTRFGTLFLIPIYLQTLRQQTAEEAGVLLAVQALATIIVLPIGGRLAGKVGSPPLVLTGLGLFIMAVALMVTLDLTTPVWLIAINLILSGAAFGLFSQIPVAAMSHIKKEAQQEVAHGATLVSVLHATAAPIGVALMSGLAQGRSQQHSLELAAQGLKGELLSRQSSLLAMHDSFMVAIGLLVVAVVIMAAVPRPKKADGERAVGTSLQRGAGDFK